MAARRQDEVRASGGCLCGAVRYTNVIGLVRNVLMPDRLEAAWLVEAAGGDAQACLTRRLEEQAGATGGAEPAPAARRAFGSTNQTLPRCSGKDGRVSVALPVVVPYPSHGPRQLRLVGPWSSVEMVVRTQHIEPAVAEGVEEVASLVPIEHPGAGTLLARGEAGKDSAPGGIREGSKRKWAACGRWAATTARAGSPVPAPAAPACRPRR
jgi:hypothetical protein